MIGPRLLGHVEHSLIHWYHLEDGTKVSFHTAFIDKARTQSITFFSDSETWPSHTALDLGLGYVFMRNSTIKEIATFITENGIKIK